MCIHAPIEKVHVQRVTVNRYERDRVLPDKHLSIALRCHV